MAALMEAGMPPEAILQAVNQLVQMLEAQAMQQEAMDAANPGGDAGVQGGQNPQAPPQVA
jgi:hypothetical protein